jgi:sec-independent protein translocase protein TatA
MDLFSPSHLLIILLIILLIFGPSKLGDVGGALGKAIKDFKHAMNEPEDSHTSATTSKAAESTSTPAAPQQESKPVKPV